MNYVLEKKDLDHIKQVIAVSKMILDNYHQIIDFKMNTGKSSLDKKVIENISLLIEIESALYKELQGPLEKLDAIMMYLQTLEPMLWEQNDFDKMITDNEKQMIFRRILNKCNRLVTNEQSFDFQQLGIDVSALTGGRQEVVQMIDLMELFEEDQYACFLSIVKKEATKNDDIKFYLISACFHLAFLIDAIERSLLKNNFNIPSQVYVQTSFMGEIYHQPTAINNMIRTQKSMELVEEQSEILLNYFDDDSLLEDQKKAEILLRLCFLRTGLLGLNDGEIKLLRSYVYDVIDCESYQKSHPNNTEIGALILESYRKVNEDRSIPIHLSLFK